MSYFWRPGADWGGGYQMMVLADPATPGQAFAGLDYGGIFFTTTTGNLWQGAMGGQPIGSGGGVDNTYYSRAAAWSAKTPGKCYVGCGQPKAKTGSALGTGFFAWQQNGTLTLSTATSYGFGTNLGSGQAANRPRAGGRLIQVDYDSGSGTEYVYALMTKSSGPVVSRTTTGNSFTDLFSTTIRTDGAWKTACLFTSSGGTFPDTLLVGSYRTTSTDGGTNTGSTVWKISSGTASIRAATSSSQLTITTIGAAPSVVEDIQLVGSNVYAACGPYGVYHITSNGTTWTQIGTSFFSNKWCSTIDGAGSTLYVGCVNTGGLAAGANTIAKSTDAGSTWGWTTTSTLTHGTGGTINSVPWGSPGNAEWWLLASQSTGSSDFKNRLGGSTFDCQQISVGASGSVYACGSAGSWVSKDGAVSWRPAVIGLNGGEVSLVVPGSGGAASSNNVDYTRCQSTDHMSSGLRSGTALTGSANSSLSAQTDGGGNTYTLTLSTPDIKRNGVSIADATFRSSLHQVSDFKVSSDGYVYLTQNAGGVLVGDPSGSGVTDTQPPTAPTTISATAGGASSVTVTWSGATDNVGVTSYHLFRGGVQVAAPSASPFTDTGLTASTTYTYTVSALDAAGNESPQSSSALATTTSGGDTTPPTAPTTISAAAVSSTSTTVTWDGATDDTAVTGYKVFRGGVQIATPAASPYTDVGLQPATTYTYTVRAFDAAGNVSPFSAGATVTTPAARTLIATVGGSTLTYTDTGLQPGTTYNYVVTASDPSGNVSADSNTASATTPTQPDTQPPTPPGNLQAAASGTSIALAWQASTDNVGVTGYRVFRSSLLLATLSPTTGYTDTTGAPGTTYTYTVTAFDGAGNESGASNGATITYPTPSSGNPSIREVVAPQTVTNATSITFAPPATAQVGDFIYAVIAASANVSFSKGQGWGGEGASYGTATSGFSINDAGRAYAATDTTYTWTWNAPANAVLHVYAITGVDPTSIQTATEIGVSGFAGTLGTVSPVTFPAMTLSSGGDLIIASGGSQGTNSITGTIGSSLTKLHGLGSPVAGLSIFAGDVVNAPNGTNGPFVTNYTRTTIPVGVAKAFKFGVPPVTNPGPTLTMEAPSDGQTVTATTINVQAMATDSDGIGEVDVSVNGGAFTGMTPVSVDADGNGTYAATVTLTTSSSPGAANTIQVQAIDGNITNPATTLGPVITINAITPVTDSTGPTITWSSPPSGTDESVEGDTGLSFTIAGTATDASGVNNIAITNPDSTVSTINTDQNGNFSYSWNLATGANAFTVVATDGSPSANTTTVSFTITLTVPGSPDVTGPTLVLTSPAADQTVRGPAGTQYNVAGSAVDPSGVASITVNGLTVPIDSEDDFSTTISLATGANSITVVATDASVNSNTTTVIHTVTLAAVQGPTLTVTDPSIDVVIVGDAPYLFQVAGTATSSVGISVVTINGMVAPVASDGSWSLLAELEDGPNTLTVTATDIQTPVAGITTIVRTITLVAPQPGESDAFNLSTDQARIAERIQERGLE